MDLPKDQDSRRGFQDELQPEVIASFLGWRLRRSFLEPTQKFHRKAEALEVQQLRLVPPAQLALESSPGPSDFLTLDIAASNVPERRDSVPSRPYPKWPYVP